MSATVRLDDDEEIEGMNAQEQILGNINLGNRSDRSHKGSSKNYVDKILAFFDHLPTPG